MSDSYNANSAGPWTNYQGAVLKGSRPLSDLSDAELMSAIHGPWENYQSNPLASMSDADLMKVLGRHPQDVSTAGDMAKSAGIGLVKGAIGLAGLPGDLANVGTKAYDYLTGSDTDATVAPYTTRLAP
jgi:hypothetical protein